jgi:AN1-type zinc finger and ubiquitin domain-containing protein 1
MGSKKCSFCKGKLGHVNYNCKCNDTFRFCGKCRMPEVHDCNYDFKTDGKKILQKQLVKVDYEKIIKI